MLANQVLLIKFLAEIKKVFNHCLTRVRYARHHLYGG